MSAANPILAELKPTARSRKTNGSSGFLDPVDGRSRYARRQRDLERAYAAELGGSLSAAQSIRVAQVAALTVRAEQLQAAIARGDEIDDEQLVRVSNALRRELAALGLAGAAEPEPIESETGSRLVEAIRRMATQPNAKPEPAHAVPVERSEPEDAPKESEPADAMAEPSLPEPEPNPQPGDVFEAEGGYRLAFEEKRRDGTERWGVYRCDGALMEVVRTREEAEERARDLAARRLPK